MTFEELINDIEKLKNLQLESVKPGSGLIIQSVDLEHGSLQILTKQHTIKSRPLQEIEKIWNELQKSPAVHVDKVLNGSGTSRNQPETILANLPYIECAKIHGKKHLVYVNEPTHPYGTIEWLNQSESAELSALMDEGVRNEEISTLVVTPNIKDAIDFFRGFCNGVVTAKEEGVYILETSTDLIAFITPSQSGLKKGTYPIFDAYNYVQEDTAVSVLGEKLVPISTADITLLIRPK